MEGRHLGELKQNYRDVMLEQGNRDRAMAIAGQDLYAPLLEVREAHPESEPNPSALNDMLTEIFLDMQGMDNEVVIAASELKSLMTATATRLDAVEATLRREKERQQDINILCNRYTDFGTVINLDASSFTGDFTEQDGVFCAKTVSEADVNCEVLSISGNGYEGNAYVYRNGGFLEDVVDTSKRAYINDSSILSAYEYSRVTASNTEKSIFPLVNLDSIEARCSIVLHSNTAFNVIHIKSDLPDLLVTEVHVSDDGATFREVSKKTLAVSSSEKKYEVQNYLPGSGIVSFPSTNYAKIVLQSKGHTDDEIAFYKTDVIDIR